jgi:cytochrome c-type biogenesis protein CcmI
MSEQIVLIVIGVVAAAFILRPLIRARGTASPRRPRPEKAPVASASQPALPEELAELELDRAMGRVSEEDYQRWRAEIEAAQPMAAAVEQGAAVEQDAGLEQGAQDDVPPADATARAEALVRKWREAPRPVCPECGERPEPAARYCSNCGTSLTA